MKLNEIRCDLCEKNKKFFKSESNFECDSGNAATSNEAINTSGDQGKCQQQQQQQQSAVVAKCLDCNFFLCASCLLDHQFISSFANHQLVAFNSLLTKEDQDTNDSFSQQNQQQNQLNTSISSLACKQQQQQQAQMSNLAQLQLQFNNLEDQLQIKRRQQQQQQALMLSSHQQQQQQRVMQIEAEIQKSYNFYMQMLKERKDYLINELNTIVQYAILNHSQNYSKQLKLKADLEQKRQTLEIAEAVQSALASDNSSKIDTTGGYMRDTNNNKINGNLTELNNLTMINNQILSQLKANNPLMSIEFVSNYSAIQTSIRNTFGYIRINNQINSASTSKPETHLSQQLSQQQNFGTSSSSSSQPSSSIYEYLTQMNNQKQQFQQQQRAKGELHIDLDPATLSKSTWNTMESANAEIPNGMDYFGNLTSSHQVINTFSGSSSSSSKSTNSSASNLTSSSSYSNCNNANNLQKQLQQKPFRNIQNLDAYLNNSSPISIATDSNSLNTTATNTNNYFLEHFGNKDWPQTAKSNSLNDMMQKSSSKQIEDMNNVVANDNNRLVNEDLFNSWSAIMSNLHNENDKVQFGEDSVSNKDLLSPYFTDSSLDVQQSSPTLSALLNGNSHKGATSVYEDLSGKLGVSKPNETAITLSASSMKSTTSSSGHSAISHSYFANKLHGNMTHDESNLMLLSNNNNNLSSQKLLSSASSASASPDERLSSLSSSASSTSSESNFHDSSLATLKSVMKTSMSTSNLGNSLLNNTAQQANNIVSNATNLAVGSSTRSQLRRSKMIYHCKFGEFGINDGQFTEPSGVTINTNNDIIVADTNSHRIQIFDKDGRFKFKFGECGKRDGQLLYPNRVSVVKHTGDIVVTERSPTHQIQIYNKYGQFLRKFGANILQHPRGVCVDNKGRIIVVECKVMRVLIFDLMGNVLQKFNCSKYLEFPNGVCCSSGPDREEIYISDNRAHCIKVFDYNGNFIRQIGGEGITNYPIGVGINSNNEILVADNHNNFNLTVFTQDGQLISALESKVKHAQCFDVGLMDDGSIVLASKDYRIYVYKYVNNNLSLSGSYSGENQLLENNEFNLGELNGNEEPLYDLFSPQVNELTNYNHLIGGLAGGAQFANSFSKSKSSDNLIDSLNSFNCL